MFYRFSWAVFCLSARFNEDETKQQIELPEDSFIVVFETLNHATEIDLLALGFMYKIQFLLFCLLPCTWLCVCGVMQPSHNYAHLSINKSGFQKCLRIFIRIRFSLSLSSGCRVIYDAHLIHIMSQCLSNRLCKFMRNLNGFFSVCFVLFCFHLKQLETPYGSD